MKDYSIIVLGVKYYRKTWQILFVGLLLEVGGLSCRERRVELTTRYIEVALILEERNCGRKGERRGVRECVLFSCYKVLNFKIR